MYKLSKVNKALEALNITEIPESKCQNEEYVNQKILEIGVNIRTKLEIEDPEVSLGDAVLQQLSSQFEKMNKADQYRVLTSMPKDSSIKVLQQTFGVSEHMAKGSQAIQEEKGLFSSPNPKPGPRLTKECLEKTANFYEDDKISRQMAGKKDCVSVLVEGEKKKVQKRQILTTLYEAFLQFKDELVVTKT